MRGSAENHLFWAIGRGFAKRGTARDPDLIEQNLRWRLLELLNIYRLVLAASILVIAVVPVFAQVLGVAAPLFTSAAGAVYLLFALVVIAALARKRPGLQVQAALEPLTDLFAAVVIVQAIGANLGILAVLLVPPVAVAAASADNRRRALFFASLATLTLLAVVLGNQLGRGLDFIYYTEAGLFGLAAFAFALAAYALARGLSETLALAQKRRLELRGLDEINRLIVARLRIGIVVLDDAGAATLVNPAARHLIGDAAIAELARQTGGQAGMRTHKLPGGATVRLTTVPLGDGEDAARLLFVEEVDAAAKQAQALKLAALGRLGAGIAHQFRNPLGAIAHAGQLLAETPGLGARETGLVQIIRRQSGRLDRLIGDLLNLARPGTGGAYPFRLGAWLEEFIAAERERVPERAARLKLSTPVADLEVRFDPVHLEHIVANLVDNAFLHGDSPAGVELVCIRRDGRATIEVRDRGPGLPADVERLFEPFATTAATGTGLGLYIARELADANGANLSALSRAGGGACFRLELAENPQWLE
ncbi:MAG: sensor histidine kinase [Gammaproteobacteria bacterium]